MWSKPSGSPPKRNHLHRVWRRVCWRCARCADRARARTQDPTAAAFKRAAEEVAKKLAVEKMEFPERVAMYFKARKWTSSRVLRRLEVCMGLSLVPSMDTCSLWSCSVNLC